MSNFTKMMYSAAAGSSGGGESDPYGSFRLVGTSNDGISVETSIQHQSIVHIPTTDNMLFADVAYRTYNSQYRLGSNLISIDKTSGYGTPLYMTQQDSQGNELHSYIMQILVDPSNSGDYYVVYNCNSNNSTGWSSVYTNSSSTRRAGSVVRKYNSSNTVQWSKVIFNYRSYSSPFTSNYSVFLFFYNGDLWVVGGSYSNQSGLSIAKMDSSNGTIAGSHNNISDTIYRNASGPYFEGNRIYDPVSNDLFIGGFHYTSTNYQYMEKFTPADSSGGFTYDYRKHTPTAHLSKNYEHSHVVDSNYVWSCTASGTGFAIRQRNKDWTWVSGTRIKYVDSFLDADQYVGATRLVQHPKDSNILIMASQNFTSQSSIRYIILSKFNKTTKVATVIDSFQLSSQNGELHGLSATATSITYSFRQVQRSVIFHLDIDDIDNDNLAHNTTNMYGVSNRINNTTVSTEAETAPTLTTETVSSINSSARMEAASDSFNGMSTTNISGTNRFGLRNDY